MSNKTIEIEVYNRTAYMLTSFAGTTTSGSLPVPDGNSPPKGSTDSYTIGVGSGTSFTIKASGSDGCAGTVTLRDAGNNVAFEIVYNQQDSGDATIQTRALTIPQCQGWNNHDSYSGDAVSAKVDLYQGTSVSLKQANGSTGVFGYVVPLDTNPYDVKRNCSDFVNSMFQKAIRGVEFTGMYDQGSAAPYMPVDFTGGSVALCNDGTINSALVKILQALWPGQAGVTPDTDSPDYPFIKFMANFLVPHVSGDSMTADTTQAPLVMYVPTFSYVATKSAGPQYQLSGYRTFPFIGSGTRFHMANVNLFLQLMLAGAHFVNIQASRDYDNQNISNTGRDLYNSFKDQFKNGELRHSCVGNSHYADHVNFSGWYYGDTYKEWAVSGSGLLVALLVGQTASGQWNTFMQLEGWPADGDVFTTGSTTGGERHGTDFANYQTSLWNISTFGAIPYSEKRGTTIFLAPASWVPGICTSTYMMPYVGAETPQPWLNTDLVSVPAGTPSLPPQYG